MFHLEQLPGRRTPTVVSSDATNFAYRGESECDETTGDHMFVGTINKLRIVDMRVDRVDAIEGETMKVNLHIFFLFF